MWNEASEWVAWLLSQGATVATLVVLLAAWTLWSAWNLGVAGRRVRDSLRTAREALGDAADPRAFTPRFEAASSAIEKNPVLGAEWRGFRQSLITPRDTSQPVFATSDVRPWFPLPELYGHAGVNLRYHTALPGFLVGAGLCVTFLGLAVALASAGGVVAPNVPPEQRNDALRHLLGAASIKFYTSLAGLFLSILYGLISKAWLRDAERDLAGFCHAVRERIPLKTPAALQAEANDLLGLQYAEVQRIGGDFFVNLGSVLDQQFNSGLETHVGPLRLAIEQLVSRLADQNENAMHDMLQAFLDKLEGSVGESMHATTATLDQLGARLDGMQGAMDAAAERMGRAADEMATGLGRGAEAALGGITGQMSTLVSTLRDLAAETERSNRTAGEEMAGRMAQSAAALTGAVESFQTRLEASTAAGMSQLAEPMQALLGHMRELAERQRAAGDQSTQALSATVGRAADALEASAEKIAQTLGGGAADASERLVAATEAMREDLRDVLARFGATLSDSGAALTQGATQGGDALRAAAAALGSDLAQSATQLRAAGEAAGAALRDGGSAAGGEITSAGRLLAEGSGTLSERLSAMGAASAALALEAQRLESGLRAATEPLAAAGANMRAAAEEARMALAPWQQTAEALRGTMNGLLGVAAAMDGAQKNAAELADRLGRVTEGFGGLDTSMAQTLLHLREALNEYQQNVDRFVNGMDQNLHRSVQGLSTIAQTLEQSIEDFMSDRARL